MTDRIDIEDPNDDPPTTDDGLGIQPSPELVTDDDVDEDGEDDPDKQEHAITEENPE